MQLLVRFSTANVAVSCSLGRGHREIRPASVDEFGVVDLADVLHPLLASTNVLYD